MEDSYTRVIGISSGDTGRLPRRGIVGHTGLAFAECFPWALDRLPHLPDFKELIVDLRTLPASADKVPAEEFYARVREGILRQVRAGGQTVVVMRKPFEQLSVPVAANDARRRTLRPVEALPVDGSFVEEEGRSVDVLNPRMFRAYLSEFRRYEFHFEVNRDSRRPGEGGGSQVSSDPILATLEKRSVAGAIRIGQGILTVLPDIPSVPIERSLELIFEGLTGISVRASAPDWVSEVSVHGVAALDQQVQAHRSAIATHQEGIEKLTAEREQLNELAGLVYLDGKHLEAIVRKALTLLGGTIKPARYAEEEYVLEFGGRDYVVEVKGSTSSANKSMVGQTIEHRMAAETKSDADIGALLVVNAWRATPPTQRVKPDKIEIPDNVAKRAAEYSLPIVSGRQLLTAVNLVLGNNRNGTEILRDILTSKGPVQLDYLKS